MNLQQQSTQQALSEAEKEEQDMKGLEGVRFEKPVGHKQKADHMHAGEEKGGGHEEKEEHSERRKERERRERAAAGLEEGQGQGQAGEEKTPAGVQVE